ncbi:MAG TPA: hypothetical protein VLO11_01560, partial [Luteolibacter sp.]|nr:hypothetical protein [Luteolibacter sp.]
MSFQAFTRWFGYGGGQDARATAPFTTRRLLAGCGLSFVFLLAACDSREKTPDWDTPGDEPPVAEATAELSPPPASPKATEEPAVRAPVPSGEGMRFAAYNVRNWLVMDRYIDRKMQRSTHKPDEEKTAVVRLLAAHSPDVIGLCEVGSAADLEEIRERLRKAGLDLPHTHFTAG